MHENKHGKKHSSRGVRASWHIYLLGFGITTVVTSIGHLVAYKSPSPIDTHSTMMETRIIGGSNTQSHRYWPFIGLIHFVDGNNRCGGVLISNEWIITSAHCLEPSNPTKT